MPAGDDEAFCAEAADALARLPGVRAVALGGSRAAGTAQPDSDWDFAVYYRGSFDPASLGTLGWPGEIFPIGGVTNEKTLLDRAGLRGADGILAGLSPEPGRLVRAVDAAGGLLKAALDEAGGAGPLAPGS